MSNLISNGGVCRTAPATPGLLTSNTAVGERQSSKFHKIEVRKYFPYRYICNLLVLNDWERNTRFHVNLLWYKKYILDRLLHYRQKSPVLHWWSEQCRKGYMGLFTDSRTAVDHLTAGQLLITWQRDSCWPLDSRTAADHLTAGLLLTTWQQDSC